MKKWIIASLLGCAMVFSVPVFAEETQPTDPESTDTGSTDGGSDQAVIGEMKPGFKNRKDYSEIYEPETEKTEVPEQPKTNPTEEAGVVPSEEAKQEVKEEAQTPPPAVVPPTKTPARVQTSNAAPVAAYMISMVPAIGMILKKRK